MKTIIDYSQYSTWLTCPWLWWYKYVAGLQPRYVGQRSDALALGALTHAGLDWFSTTGRLMIPPEVVAEINPTPECLELAERLVRGYLQKYPRDDWQQERTEQAVEFPLVDYNQGGIQYVWKGIAKLDSYFYVPEDTTIDSGLHDQRLTLGRGWWAREYKTKSHGIARDVWMKEWASKRQADFQLLALQHRLESQPRHHGDDVQVRGVLVSVLEKPREYVPSRKCKGCGNSYDLAAFREHAEGHMCPMCGHVQKLKPYEPKVPSNPEFYRIIVTRSPEQLEVARREIAMVAEAMEDMAEEGRGSVIPNRDNCISNRYHRQCEFAEQDIAGVEPSEPTFVKIDPYKYIGIQP